MMVTEQNKVKVSILVPCYNVQQYLPRCLNSICSQTLKGIELICVDDGSNDLTLSILEEYAARDSRIKVISKKNTGYGDSLNVALQLASGEYIGIVEPDDYIENTMYEKLYHLAKNNQLDLARCNYFYHKKEGVQIQSSVVIPKNTLIKPTESIGIFFQPPSVWANIYRRTWLLQNEIFFLPTPGASYQDISFSFKAYLNAERLMVLDQALLHYNLENENSSVHNPKKIFCVMDEWNEIYKLSHLSKFRRLNIWSKLPEIQIGNYIWNLNHLDWHGRKKFLFAWQKEVKKRLRDGEISFSNLRLIYALVVFFIANTPYVFLFYNRNNSIIKILKKWLAKK